MKVLLLSRTDYLQYCNKGDFLEWEYDVYDGCSSTIHIHKEFLSWGDTYMIDYANPEDEIMGLMLVLAIDAANCSEENSH